MVTKPFTRRQRDDLLARYWATWDVEREADLAGDGPRRAKLDKTLLALAERYAAGVPRVALARCPFTDAVVRHSLDTFDLDGLWWNHDAPQRPPEPDLPPTFFALTGAVRIAGPIAYAPFLCKPGPEAPYVIPRILDRRGVKAVLASLAVGPHVAYAITYLARPLPGDLRGVNTWGADHHLVRSASGVSGWDAMPEWEPDFDFDLRPWVKRGKLLWIAADDDRLQLRSDVGGCPYLELPGHRTMSRIQRGDVMWPPAPAPTRAPDERGDQGQHRAEEEPQRPERLG